MPPRIPHLSILQKDTIINIGKAVRATKYDNVPEQRAFLDTQAELLVHAFDISDLFDYNPDDQDSFAQFFYELAATPGLAEVFHVVKNTYHQTVVPNSDPVIGGRYPVIADLCARLKTAKECSKAGVLVAQQQHRAQLDDVRDAAEAQNAQVVAARDAACASKDTTKKKAKNKKKSKSKAAEVTVDDINDEVSIVDDTEAPGQGSGEADDPMNVDATESVSGEIQGHRSTRSLDGTSSAMAILSRTDPTSGSRVVAEEFSLPTTVQTCMGATVTVTEGPVALLNLLHVLVTAELVARLSNSHGHLGPVAFKRVATKCHGGWSRCSHTCPYSTRKRPQTSQSYAHEDSQSQFEAAELAVNNPQVKESVSAALAAATSDDHPATIGSLRLEESGIRSRLAYANAQLRYQLNHREYLLGDLKHVLDAQHRR
ncbi:hypothetical protein B0H17DRAFT_1142869 [Mycena rosella]|uniref:Uncharacterized protein n=1 Tax=Mycena rosella TaxID=1033263 RepID=A0AAD7CW96_MYCRO|nr:hypothetical protein B0H17DRAFT_1142869 [Mycena rosella]